MLLKKLKAITVASFLVLPIVSFAAEDLSVVNNTSAPTTSRINGSFCSDPLLGDIGVTPNDGQDHMIPGQVIHDACWANMNECTAEVYLGRFCSGPKIAEIKLNAATDGSVFSVTPSSGYSVKASPHRVIISPN